MNAKIERLLKQATTIEHGVDNGFDRSTVDQLKFAELIIKECIDQIYGEYIPVKADCPMMDNPHWRGYVQCGTDSVVAIKQHFKQYAY
jgi:hypothetical protein